MRTDALIAMWQRGGKHVAKIGSLAACAVLLSGCARSTITTTVNPDGSWVRKLTFHAPAAKPNNPQPEVKLEDVFVLPSGLPWKTTRTQKEEEIIYTAERVMKAGETLAPDMTLKGSGDLAKKGGPLRNEVSVREIAPGRWEYRETLHWQGEMPKDLAKPDPEALLAIKNALPPALATEANVQAVNQVVTRAFWRMLFGPGDPLIAQLFGQLMMNPDLAERRMMQRVSGVILKGLEEKLGAQMTPEERLQVTRRLVQAISKSTETKVKSKTQPDAAAPGDKDNSGAMVALTYSVKLPGRVVETNGEVDELNGEVFWALYPEAAAVGDVVLLAICEVGK
jgi:hypothetical protein